jgi:ABC-type multidrug transport system fused ATPase/permease subunit
LTGPDDRGADAPAPGGLWNLAAWTLVSLRPHWRVALLVVAGLLVQVAFETIFPLGYKWLIDWAIIPRDPRWFAIVMAGLGAAFLVSSVVTVAREYLCADLGVRTVNAIRVEMARRLHVVSLDFFTRTPAGDLTARFTADLRAIEQVVGRSLPGVIGGGLSLAVSAVVLFVLEWRLALVTMAALPLTLVGARLLVVRGSVAVSRTRAGEAEQLLRVLQDGDFFGEIALLEDVRRTSTVRALVPTLLPALTRPHFLRLLEAAPGVRRTVEAAAAARRKDDDAFVGGMPLV